VLYLALLSCSLCYLKLHVVRVLSLLFEQIKKEGKEGRKSSVRLSMTLVYRDHILSLYFAAAFYLFFFKF